MLDRLLEVQHGHIDRECAVEGNGTSAEQHGEQSTNHVWKFLPGMLRDVATPNNRQKK